MLTASLAILLLPPAKLTKPTIVAASLFKNGYAVVTRAIDVHGGQAVIEDIPQGALGTVWFQSTEGIKIDSIKNTQVQVPQTVAVENLEGLLAQNVGQTVSFDLDNKRTITGKLLSVSSTMVILETASGQSAYPVSRINSLDTPGKFKRDFVINISKQVVEVKVAGKADGRLYMIGLERGLSWSPAYALDMSDPKKLKLTAKATIIDDLDALPNIETRLVTGFPNLLYPNVVDPLLAQASLDAYVQSIGAADAAKNAQYGVAGAARGAGMGGQSMGMMTQNAAPQMSEFAGSMTHNSLDGTQQEDLYFYKQPNVNLEKGDRAYYILAEAKLNYDQIYTWDSAASIINNAQYSHQPPQVDVYREPEEVWHALEFSNTAGLPLTTGPATTFKNGEILGQDMLKYTSPGAKTIVKITKALDVGAQSVDEETARERGALKIPNYPTYDLITLKTTLRVDNRKGELIHLRITRPFLGEIIDAPGATVSKRAKGLRSVNAGGFLEYRKDVEAGKSLTLTYTSKVYIMTGLD